MSKYTYCKKTYAIRNSSGDIVDMASIARLLNSGQTTVDALQKQIDEQRQDMQKLEALRDAVGDFASTQHLGICQDQATDVMLKKHSDCLPKTAAELLNDKHAAAIEFAESRGLSGALFDKYNVAKKAHDKAVQSESLDGMARVDGGLESVIIDGSGIL